MTEGEHSSAGELSSFLHLSGWRPLFLALVAGLAGAVGLFLALGEPSQWVSRYVINGQRVAESNLQPGQLDIFVEEIVQTSRFPVVVDEVERETGLVHEEDYEITISQAPASVALANVNVVADRPEDSQAVAVQTSISALRVTLVKNRTGLEANRDRLDREVANTTARANDLIGEAGGVSPDTAYTAAANRLLEQRSDPDPDVSTARLEADVARLEPLDTEYRQLQTSLAQLNVRLGDLNNSISEASGHIEALDREPDAPFIISEVITEETSRIAKLLTGVMLFAIPAALLTILGFVAFDGFRRRSLEPLVPSQPIDSYGILDANSQRALPEASVTKLQVVDEADLLAEDEGAIPVGEAIDDIVDDPDDDPEPKKAKDSRWGRSA
ncbi:MAG: hypothetical protein HKN94_17165 [Acidimicrobiales bacterium]|nr:hypothetical protein [Acidimicrobiales bacterium]RZV48535.1 MAG: hypothetical protein EX269_01305 [Acidimicrobiales bacterium]